MPNASTVSLLLNEFSTADQALLGPVIGGIWSVYADQAGVTPRLQYLYAERHCLDFLLKQTYTQVDNQTDDVKSADSDKAARLQAMRAAVDAAIKQEQANAQAGRTAKFGLITRTAPEAPISTIGPDPNDSMFRGDPQRRSSYPR